MRCSVRGVVAARSRCGLGWWLRLREQGCEPLLLGGAQRPDTAQAVDAKVGHEAVGAVGAEFGQGRQDVDDVQPTCAGVGTLKYVCQACRAAADLCEELCGCWVGSGSNCETQGTKRWEE